MKALYLKKYALVWLPSVDFTPGVYEYYPLPTIVFMKDNNKNFLSLSLYIWRWAIISIIKTV